MGMTRTEVSNALGRNTAAPEIRLGLEILKDEGMVEEIKERPSGGRPATRYRITGAGQGDVDHCE